MDAGHDITTPGHVPFAGLWWPCFLPGAPGGGRDTRGDHQGVGQEAPTPVANLRSALRDKLHPSTRLGGSKLGIYATAWQGACDAADGILHKESNAMWTASGIRTAILTLTLKARYGLLWNAKLAKRYRMQYLAGRKQGRPGGISDGRCPHCGLPDSTGHILGYCRHKRMLALYIERHNEAVRMVCKALRKSSTHGGCYTIMDACRRNDAETHGAAGTRLTDLDWLLPSLTAEQRALLRPDILRVTGLPAAPTATEIADATANKGQHWVQIIEVGYTTDTCWLAARTRKEGQHSHTQPAHTRPEGNGASGREHGSGTTDSEDGNSGSYGGSTDGDGAGRVHLKQALEAEGWTVDGPHIILIGKCGSVYKGSLTALQQLGLNASTGRQLLRKIHLGTVRTLRDIVAARRELDSGAGRTGVG